MDPFNEEDGNFNSSSGRYDSSFSRCKKHLVDPDRPDKVRHYRSIIEGLDDGNFDQDSKLTDVFLSRFTCEDISLLIVSFIRGEISGEVQNIWSFWAQQYTQHNEVEWATIWTFWLLQYLPQSLKNWDRVDEWKDGVPAGLLTSFSAAEMNLFIQAGERGTRPFNNWGDWAIKYPAHAESRWREFWAWFRPIFHRPKPDDGPENIPKSLPKMTPLARKFGPSVHFQFQVTGEEGHTIPRSGLTPTEPLLGGPVQTSLEYEKAQEYVRYQKEYIDKQWSLRHYHLMEVLTEEQSFKPSSLTNEIIPALARDRWHYYAGPDRMPDGRPWNVRKYDDLWEAMGPSLRLASKLLTECHLETWWNDLAFALDRPGSNLVPIASTDQHYFKKSDPSVRLYQKQIDWSFLASHITIRICHDETAEGATWLDKRSLIDEYGNIPSDPNAVYCHMLLGSADMMPLMDQGDKKMNAAEKLVHSFFIASIIIHEMAHAYHYIFCPNVQVHPNTEEAIRAQGGIPEPPIDEPFYEDEDFAELGWSMETGVFGGIPRTFIFDPREKALKEGKELTTKLGYPRIGFFIVPTLTFLNWNYFLSSRRNDGQWQKPEQSFFASPIPLYYYSEIQQDEFWNVYVNAYGAELLKPKPMLSTRYSRLSNMSQKTHRVRRIEYGELLAKGMGLSNSRKWWSDDDAIDFDNPLTAPYYRRKLGRETTVALRLEFSLLEDERHAKIRRGRETPEEARRVGGYKKLRKRLKVAYDRERLEDYKMKEMQELFGGAEV